MQIENIAFGNIYTPKIGALRYINTISFTVCLRELKQGICISLDVWDGRAMGGRFQREGTCVHLWLIHIDV